MLDEFLQSSSPFGMTWAMTFAYAFLFLLVGLIAIALSRANKAKLLYWFIMGVGVILFLKHIVGWDITGILWDAWLTLKSRLLGVIWWG